MKRFLPWIIALVIVVGFCWVFPPIRIRSMAQVKTQVANAQFNAKAYVDTFWRERLTPAFAEAADATKLLTLLAESPQKVRAQFGRTVGISSSYFLFVRGTGRVVSMSGDSIGLAVNSAGDAVDVFIPLGLLFGSAVRDASGLLSSSSFPKAQEFNDISAELNQFVETKVLPELRRIAVVGQRLEFVGCVEVADEQEDLKPLKLVPISVAEPKD
jgi:predicted lipoprotein